MKCILMGTGRIIIHFIINTHFRHFKPFQFIFFLAFEKSSLKFNMYKKLKVMDQGKADVTLIINVKLKISPLPRVISLKAFIEFKPLSMSNFVGVILNNRESIFKMITSGDIFKNH